MILNIDKKILELFDKKDLKVYFYNSWCEWTKVNITQDFEKKYLESIIIEDKNIYFSKDDWINLDWWKIILQTKENNDWHWWKNKFLFVSEKIKSRCSCSSSFSFEKKLIDKEKLNKLKNAFK